LRSAALRDAADGPLSIGVLGEHSNPSVHNIAAAVQARGAVAHIIDLGDVQRGSSGLTLAGRPLPHMDLAIGYHGAEVPSGGMQVMRQLERDGVAFVNGPAGIRTSRDKWLAAQAFEKAGVLTPATRLARTGLEARAHAAELGMPVILKLRIGTEGKGVAKLSELNEVAPVADMVIAARRNMLVQQMIQMRQPADIRAFVVGDRVVAAMKRTVGENRTGDFRTNLSNSGSGVAIRLHPKDAANAVRTAQALRLKVAGVDLMGDWGAMRTIEGNSGPGQKIREITGVDVADEIAQLLVTDAQAARSARLGGQGT